MADKNANKTHISIVVAGHVDSGKSTTTGHLMYELGGITDRDLEKMRKLAEDQGKGSFTFAYFLDTTKAERERGITISCTTREFFTSNYHYSIIDAPGHIDFIKNMLSGSAQADVALLMVPSDDGFIAAIKKETSDELAGQTRQHAKLLQLLGVKQLIVGINKMDDKIVNYSEARYKEVRDEMANMLIKCGWPKGQVEKGVPFLPISGWVGDNLFKKSDKMPWWNGTDVAIRGGGSVHVDTLYDALDKMVQQPIRNKNGPMRLPLSGFVNKPGIGDIVTGRVEQGVVTVGSSVVFLPRDTPAAPCRGKVFTIEMHHNPVEIGETGFNIGINIKGLSKDKNFKPQAGDVMILESDTTLKPAKRFTCQCQVLDHPGELKVGYTPVGFVRTAKAPLKIVEIKWRSGKETSDQKQENPPHIKSGDMCELVIEPQKPFVVEPFDKCEGLSRVAVMDSKRVTMICKVTAVEY